MEEAGLAIQAIKPVFMMSPLSVAAYLPPKKIRFDVVVFDEASQITPVDAYGAMLRGAQVVVVGDSQQLPPTPFFASMSDGSEEDESEDLATGDLESVLGLFSAKGAPSRMLRWHYRSRHHSLIAVSNYEFYENRLVVLPSAMEERVREGLVYRHLGDTAYKRGREGAVNPAEAAHVAKAVMEHARRSPNLTLGVAAFSVKQQQVILDQLELLRRQDPSCEDFFASHPEEPFFVKNLENVQGDERDVIFISVGYGRTEDGYVSMNFGPLNQQGGERRLNVLISRARCRCEVFTNLRASDLDLRRTNARGVEALKTFLEYAETGLLGVPSSSGREADSVFEIEVADRLKAAGCDVELQVGTGGFFVDIGIRDPEMPGRFLLGVECDGASYHSAAWARDRDRIRQQVLERRGWTIHRVWSTDWFQNPDRELNRILEAVKAELSVPLDRRAGPRNEEAASSEVQPAINRAATELRTAPNLGAIPYRVATPTVNLHGLGLHEVRPEESVRWLAEIVAVESPVHFDEAAQRVVEASGGSRLGSRIRENLWRAVLLADRTGVFKNRRFFLWKPESSEPEARDRSALPNSSRKIEYVCDEEISAALLKAVRSCIGIEPDAAAQQVCRMLGFARTTDGMKSRMNMVLKGMMSRGQVVEVGSHLALPGM